MLDIIIPIYNEEKILIEREDYFRTLARKARVIFIDGQSTDRSRQVASGYADVLSSPRGRGIQKDAGGRYLTGENLMFLHADTTISPEALGKVEAALENGTDYGCLTLAIDDPAGIFKAFGAVVNFRARYCHVIDGDLGLFVKRAVYQRAGGFAPLPYMEDIELSGRLRKCGKAAILPEEIRVSSRKWKEQGFCPTLLRYARAYGELWTGALARKAEAGDE